MMFSFANNQPNVKQSQGDVCEDIVITADDQEDEKKCLKTSSEFDFANGFKNINSSSRISPDTPMLPSDINDYDHPKLKHVMSEYTEPGGQGTFKESAIKPDDSTPRTINLGSQSQVFDTQQSAHFGSISAISCIKPSKASSGLFGSAFPSVVETKKDEKLVVSLVPKSIQEQSLTLSAVETQSVNSSQIEQVKDKSFSQQPTYANVIVEDKAEDSPERDNQDKLDEPEAFKYIIPRTEPKLDSCFVIPRHIPQLLLFTRWSEISERLINEAFELDYEDLTNRPVRGLSCLYAGRSEGSTEKYGGPSYGAIMRMMFESCCSLQISLNARKSWPISVIGPTLQNVLPEHAPMFVSKVMEQWASELFLSEDPKLLWEDGSGKKIINSFKPCSLSQLEEDRSKEIFSSSNQEKDSRFLDGLQSFSAIIKPARLRKYTVAARIGNQKLVTSLRIVRSSVTVDDLLCALKNRNVELLRTCEQYCNRLHDQLDELSVAFKKQESLHRLSLAYEFLTSKLSRDLFDLNCKAFDFGIARDQFLLYRDECGKLLTDKCNICDIDPGQGSSLKIFRTHQNMKVMVFFVKVIYTKTGRQTFEQSVLAPADRAAEFQLEHVIRFALTESFLQAEGSTPEDFEKFLSTSKDRLILQGNTISNEDLKRTLSDIASTRNDQDSVIYIDIVRSDLCVASPSIDERGLQLEFGPQLELTNLETQPKNETVLINIDAKMKDGSQMIFSLPAKLGSYVRVSAFEPVRARVIARVYSGDSWREVDYSPCGVYWTNEADIGSEKGYWTSTIYQLVSSKNSNNED